MKKTLLALAIASISTSAFAVNTSSENSLNQADLFEFSAMHADQFKVGGSVGIGGYYNTKAKAVYDDWATALTVAVEYRNNSIVGYVETDLMLNYTTDSKNTKGILPGGSTLATNVDKAWLGFDTGFGVLSYGWENDTALDAVDGKGDNTYEFGSSAGIGDAFNVAKFQGSTSGFAYGISYFDLDENRAVSGANGYLGLEQEMFNIYAGYEKRSNHLKTTTVTGNVMLGQLTVGANVWRQDGAEAKDLADQTITGRNTGYYVSGAFALNDALTLAAGYNATEFKPAGEHKYDASYFNVAAMYTMAKNIDMGIDVRRDLKVEEGNDKETYVFAAAYYYF